ELAVNVAVTHPGASVFQQRPACVGEGFRTAGKVADAVIDVVRILLLVPALEGMALHGHQCRYRTDGDFDPVPDAVGHAAIDGNELAESQGQVSAIRTLDSEARCQRRNVPHDLRLARHQEIDDDVDG